jgi:hypothetical protein
MAKKSRRKKQPFNWHKAGRIALRTASILLLIVLAVGLTFGVDRLRTHADTHMRLASHGGGGSQTGAEIRFRWPALAGNAKGTWLAIEDQQLLLSDAARAVGTDSPLSAEPLRRLSETLNDTGWFRSVPTVKRIDGGVLLVDGDWRIPAAVVRWDGRDHAVSREGYPMPPVYRVGTAPHPFIQGVFGGAVGIGPDRYATPWPGPGVSVGLDLIAALRANGLSGRFAGVDVSGYLSGGPIEIVSPDGNRIVWGSPVDEWTPGEPSVEEKMARLVQLVERTGLLDAGQRRIEIHRARVEIDRTGED